jgi:hypothetical protein
MSRNADKMIRDRKRVLQTLEPLSEAVIVDLVRRAGKREHSKRSGERVSVSRGSLSDPTGSAVVATMMGKDQDQDSVFEAVKSIAQILNEMAAMSLRLDQKVRFVTEAQIRAKEAGIVHCAACGREVAGTPADRLRSGYCSADYTAWLRQGKPYRATFEAQVRARVAEGT